MTLNQLFSWFSRCKQEPLTPTNEQPQLDQRVPTAAQDTLREAQQAPTQASSIKNLCYSVGASLSKAAQKVADVFKKIFYSVKGCFSKHSIDETEPLSSNQPPPKSSKEAAKELFNDPTTKENRNTPYAKTIPMLIASQLDLPEKKACITDFLASYELTIDEVLSLESLGDRVKDPSQLNKVLEKVLEKDANAAKNAWLFGRLLLCYQKGTTKARCIERIIQRLLALDMLEQCYKRGIFTCQEQQSNSAHPTEGNEYRAWALGYLSIYDPRYIESLKISIEPLKADENNSNVLWAIVMALQSAHGESYQTYKQELMNITGKGSIREALEKIPVSDFRGWATSLTLLAASSNQDQEIINILRASLDEQLTGDMPRDDRMLVLTNLSLVPS